MPLTLQLAGTLLLVVAVVVCVYHLLLAAVAMYPLRLCEAAPVTVLHRFAIVIPAHNEESLIADTLSSCSALDYPREALAIYVIADNCTDRTADIADTSGAICLQRHDERHRGKGAALEWAFAQLLDKNHDAFVVLDADCVLDRHALRRFDTELAHGHLVLQASDSVANTDDNSLTYLLALANTLENDLFYAPKSRLGLAVALRGTGMVLHRDVLARCPWNATSLTEDAEYCWSLLEAGIPTRFVADVHVRSRFPSLQGELETQRRRWISGGMHLARRFGPGLVLSGLMQRRAALMDAGFTTWIVNRPLIVAELMLTLLVAIACQFLLPDAWSFTLVVGSMAVVFGYVTYVALGILLVGLTPRRCWLVLGVPWQVVRYLAVAQSAVFGRGPSNWIRTPRLRQPQMRCTATPTSPTDSVEWHDAMRESAQ